jgi:hypothetical protein
MNAMIAISRFRPRRSEGERQPLMDVAFLGRSGEKCFIRRRGARRLRCRVAVAAADVIWEGERSGTSMPGRRKARRRWEFFPEL